MNANIFMPRGLPLLSDPTLLHTLLEYRRNCRMLAANPTTGTDALLDQVTQAIEAVESELRARGVDPLSAAPQRARTLRLEPAGNN